MITYMRNVINDKRAHESESTNHHGSHKAIEAVIRRPITKKINV